MLVLTRKLHEKVIIACGDQIIVISVAHFDVGRVRLGFTASPDVTIYREEVAPNELLDELDRRANG